MKNLTTALAALALLFSNAEAIHSGKHSTFFAELQAKHSHAQTGNFFAELKKSFAREGQTDEEAYLEIAKKLMNMSDKLDDLKKCMNELGGGDGNQGNSQSIQDQGNGNQGNQGNGNQGKKGKKASDDTDVEETKGNGNSNASNGSATTQAGNANKPSADDSTSDDTSAKGNGKGGN